MESKTAPAVHNLSREKGQITLKLTNEIIIRSLHVCRVFMINNKISTPPAGVSIQK